MKERDGRDGVRGGSDGDRAEGWERGAMKVTRRL